MQPPRTIAILRNWLYVNLNLMQSNTIRYLQYAVRNYSILLLLCQRNFSFFFLRFLYLSWKFRLFYLFTQADLSTYVGDGNQLLAIDGSATNDHLVNRPVNQHYFKGNCKTRSVKVQALSPRTRGWRPQNIAYNMELRSAHKFPVSINVHINHLLS